MNKPAEPSLAIIIVNWNGYDDTILSLNSLRNLTYKNYEVIVVDNGSEDDSGDRLKLDFDEITLLKNSENLGFTGGNNRGLEYALEKDFDLVMLLNNDTVVTPNFVQPLVTAISKPEIGAVQPKILFNKEREVIWNVGSHFNYFWFYPKTRGGGKVDKGQYDRLMSIPWVTGCCFLISTSLIREIGLLDDQFFIYYEDTDWSLRIRRQSLDLLVVPDSLIYHEVGSSHKKRSSDGEGNLSPFAHYVTIRNHIFLLRKHHSVWNLPSGLIYQILKLIAYLAYFTLKGRPKKRRATLKGFWDGFKTPLTHS